MKMSISFIFPFLFLLLNLLNSPTLVVGAIGDGETYEYHVVGQLFCNGTPWQDQQIDMYDVDCMSSDDHMANGMTDKEGKFELRGTHADGWGETDPGGLNLPNPYLLTDKDCVSLYPCTYDRCACMCIIMPHPQMGKMRVMSDNFLRLINSQKPKLQ
jgi:hypothetical protein